MRHRQNLLALSSAVLATVVAGLLPASPAIAQEKSTLDKHFVYEFVRVFYTQEGKSAVPPTDKDQDGVPDHVEDVAKQVWAAHHLYCDVLDFPNPFESERFKGANCIQVSIRDTTEMSNVNGVAFSSAQRARRIPEGKPDDRCVVMAIAKHVKPTTNVTPAHETFHLVQYGASYFKGSWYLEGQARWAEHGLAKDGLGEVKYSPVGPWPQATRHLQQLVQMGSKSETVLWNPIAARTDSKGLLTEEMLGEELLELRYSDGSPVLKDRYLQGAELMRDVLLELGKQDDAAFEDLGYESWSGENQQSAKNNPYIYKAIMDALRLHASRVGRFEIPRQNR